MKTWEETIQFIRSSEKHKDLVRLAYLEEDLVLNIERFKADEEFTETLKLLRKYSPDAQSILDIGSGNGISAIAFALEGYKITVVEPDPSETIGAGAIRKLADHYKIEGLTVHEKYAEEIGFQEGSFDVVYIRQAMHHAYDLNRFIGEASRVLKKGGILITVRDHVVYNEKDKQLFLDTHPLHGFYGGENAFTESEYRSAFNKAGLEIQLMLKHFESVINYFPMSKAEFMDANQKKKNSLIEILKNKVGPLAKLSIIQNWYFKKLGYPGDCFLNEEHIPGRMYTFIGRKQ